MAVFFTSDTHFGQANIIRYCSRPFGSVQETDDAMIANWNAIVRPSDDVWHLGNVKTRGCDRDVPSPASPAPLSPLPGGGRSSSGSRRVFRPSARQLGAIGPVAEVVEIGWRSLRVAEPKRFQRWTAGQETTP
jgi:hypothetical protein